MFYVVEDDLRGKFLAKLLLKDGFYLGDHKNDMKFANYLYLGLKGVDRQNRIMMNNQIVYVDFNQLKEGSYVFTIVYNEYLNEIAHKYKFYYYSLMKDEAFVDINSKLTAEGLLSYMIDKINQPLYQSHILLLGYGRCGKEITKRLDSFSVKIDIFDKKREDIINDGYSYGDIDKIDLSTYDIVINTIPEMILNQEHIKMFKKEVMMFDIASYPYGIDHHEALRQGISAYIVSSIPNRYYPNYSAYLIYETIKRKGLLTC